MSVTALIPIKALVSAKGRLAQALTPAERAALATDMLTKVVAAARAVPSVDAVAIVSPDQWPELGVRVIGDTAGELNAAVEAAVTELALAADDLLLVLSADLPWIQPDDIEAMLAAARSGVLAIGRDEGGEGTNALAFQIRCKPRFRFGLGSCAAHRAEAASLGIEAEVLHRRGLAFDVDDPQALARFNGQAGQP